MLGIVTVVGFKPQFIKAAGINRPASTGWLIRWSVGLDWSPNAPFVEAHSPVSEH